MKNQDYKFWMSLIGVLFILTGITNCDGFERSKTGLGGGDLGGGDVAMIAARKVDIKEAISHIEPKLVYVVRYIKEAVTLVDEPKADDIEAINLWNGMGLDLSEGLREGLTKALFPAAGKNMLTILSSYKIQIEMDRACYDKNNNEVDGSIYNVPTDTYCISAHRLAEKLDSINYKRKTLSLIIHELSHLVGANENLSVLIAGITEDIPEAIVEDEWVKSHNYSYESLGDFMGYLDSSVRLDSNICYSIATLLSLGVARLMNPEDYFGFLYYGLEGWANIMTIYEQANQLNNYCVELDSPFVVSQNGNYSEKYGYNKFIRIMDFQEDSAIELFSYDESHISYAVNPNLKEGLVKAVENLLENIKRMEPHYELGLQVEKALSLLN